jgi:hypothetical protein
MNLCLLRRARRRRATSSQSFCTILMLIIAPLRLCMNVMIRPVAKMGSSQNWKVNRRKRKVCQRTLHPRAIIPSCVKLWLSGRQRVHVVCTSQPVLVLDPQASMTQRGADSPHQLPPLTHRGGTATGIKWHV